jgi:triosephosphate isomerase
MRKLLVAGNWKMHGSRADTRELIDGLDAALGSDSAAEVLVCPPYVYLCDAADALRGTSVVLGAQNVAVEASGAYTGEIAGTMLRDVGCRYVIVGHSERRSIYGEEDGLVAAKFRSAQRDGLTPILCVGESRQETRAPSRHRRFMLSSVGY